MKSLSAQQPLPENRHTKQQALQFLLSLCITTPFSTLGFLVQPILQIEEIITTVDQKEKEIKKKVFMGLRGRGGEDIKSTPPHITVSTA
jgi:hypothetical protein